MRSIAFVFTLLLFLVATAARAAAPDAMVQATVEEVLAAMKKTDNKRALLRLAEEKLVPKFDFREMTRLAVGRPWRDATPAQQEELESGFRGILVNTYAAAFNRVDLKTAGIPTVDVRPVQLSPNQNDALVRTFMRWQNKRQVQVDYRLLNTPDGWKITDVVVEGLSLVITYRGTFTDTINRSGIAGLIQALEEKNRTISRG